MFFALAGLMLILALAFVLVPLARQKSDAATPAQAPSADETNLDVLRQQRAELEREFANGQISAAERDHALQELAARLASEIDLTAKVADQSAPSGKNAPKRPWMLGFGISAFILTGSIAGYAVWGAHQARQLSQMTEASAAANPDMASASQSDKQILAMVDSLAKKMEENPSDPKGWMLLARSQGTLGRWPEAVRAYERASQLVPNDANVLADYADALAMLQEGSLAGKPTELTLRALKVDPKNLKALALAGTAALRAGDKKASLSYWQRMQAELPPDSEDAKQVAAIIAEVKGQPIPTRGAPDATPAPSTAPSPPAAAPMAKAAAGQSTTGKSIQGSVGIAPGLVGKLAAGDTLFVFARAAGQNAPRMPLAVLRVGVPSKWPFAFELTDAMAMAPNMNLSQFAEVIVEARISKSGNAAPQPGDLGGLSTVLKPGATGVSLTINKVVGD